MGFTPSKAEPCIWMRENQKLKCYEYAATYADDLCIAGQVAGKIIQTHKEDYKLKVKGDGLLSHHLGADYTRDKDKTLVCRHKKYIDRLVDSYHSMFKHDPPNNMRTPWIRMISQNWMTLNYSLASLSNTISPWLDNFNG